MILIDVYTREGIVGRSYLEPYLKDALGCIIALIQTLGAAHVGKPIAPLDVFQFNRGSQNLIGYEGVAMIATSGIDMAIWDALAKAAGLPLTRLFGGTVGPVPAYNSNGLWLTDVSTQAQEAAELVAEGGFAALKLRLGRDGLAADLAAIREVRRGCRQLRKADGRLQPGTFTGRCLAPLSRARRAWPVLAGGADRL